MASYRIFYFLKILHVAIDVFTVKTDNVHRCGGVLMLTNSYKCENPVLLRIFRRPEMTKQVLEVLRHVRPAKLYISGDGPKGSSTEEDIRVSQAREIATNIDWECDIHTRFWEENVGGPQAGFEGISWFFRHEPQGIILEDDNLPNIDFFRFCDVLLERYKYDPSIFAITGNNFQDGQLRGEASYYFSKFPHCWGWATWRRAWQYSSLDISFWDPWKRSKEWINWLPDAVERQFWEKKFDDIFFKRKVHWDHAWAASCWHRGGLTVTPNLNLVSNIGFGEGATNTANPNDKMAKLPMHSLGELSHPLRVEQDKVADRYVFDHVFGGRSMRFPLSVFWFARRLVGFFIRRSKSWLS